MTSRRAYNPDTNMRERAGRATLDDAGRARLRALVADKTVHKVAQTFGSSVTTIENVVDGVPIKVAALERIAMALYVIDGKHYARVPEKARTVKMDS